MPKYIRITDVPPGQAPRHIRESWVGVEIPLLDDGEVEPDGLQVGVYGGPAENLGGYKVSGKVAVAKLEERDPVAARYWEITAPYVFFVPLVFARDVCEVFEGPAE